MLKESTLCWWNIYYLSIHPGEQIYPAYANMLAHLVATYPGNVNIPDWKKIVCTYDDKVLAYPPMHTSGLGPAHMKKQTPSGVFLHVADATPSGSIRIMIHTVDTDVVVLAVSLLSNSYSLMNCGLHL